MGLTLIDPTQVKNTSTFRFTASVPNGQATGDLSVPGDNTVTFAPVPAGVNGTDTQHYLYISGGTGTAEAALIVGGTAVACALTGTIILRTVNAHTGGWAISSASAGIKEACNVIGGVGSLALPPGTSIAQGIIVLPTTVSLTGHVSNSGAGLIGSIVSTTADPGMVIADNRGTATNQGLGIHSSYTLYGPGSGSGFWVGGDPSSVFAPSTWTGSYIRFSNVASINFATAVAHNRGNFVNYTNSVMAGLTRALIFPSTGGGDHQPVTSNNCLWSVPSGAAIQMDDSGFATNMFQMFGDQVSGAITGNDAFIECNDVHFEPNDTLSPIVDVSGNRAILKINDGILSVHSPSPPTPASMTDMIIMSGSGGYSLTVINAQVQADVGLTVTNFVNFSTSLLGKLRLGHNEFAQAGTFTNVYAISKATLDASVTLSVDQPLMQSATGVAAGATITFPGSNSSYPNMGQFLITGGTVGGSGITAVSGLTAYSLGMLRTQSAQTFTAGATIGNTITTVVGLPYQFYFDGTKIWIG